MARHKGPGRDSTSAKAIEVAQRHAKWLELRLSGKSYRAIAELEGVEDSTVHEAVTRRLRQTVAEPSEALRVLELQRLDALLESVWDTATGSLVAKLEERAESLASEAKPPNSEAIHAIIDAVVRAQLQATEQARKVLADRRRMLGLDAPMKVDIQSAPTVEVTLEELRKLLNTMGYDVVPLDGAIVTTGTELGPKKGIE